MLVFVWNVFYSYNKGLGRTIVSFKPYAMLEVLLQSNGIYSSYKHKQYETITFLEFNQSMPYNRMHQNPQNKTKYKYLA